MTGHLCDLAYSRIALVMRSRTEGTYFIGITVNKRGASGRKWGSGDLDPKTGMRWEVRTSVNPIKDDLNRPSQ